MASDPVRRSAARTATFVAVPLAVAVLAISAVAFGGFGSSPNPAPTGPVSMTARELSPDVETLCQLLISDLPTAVVGKDQRPVTEGSEQNAAYGDPPVTVECGVELPTVGATDQVVPLIGTGEDGQPAGACWYPQVGDGRTVWTSVDRTVPVRVTVPGALDGSAQFVVPFSAAVATDLPLRDSGIPTGCTDQPPS